MPDTYVSGDLQWAWDRFEGMISSVADITNYQPVFEDYMYRAYSEFLQDKVQYVEFRTLLMPVCKVQSEIESKDKELSQITSDKESLEPQLNEI